MIRVFVVDDHELVRRGLADLLTSAGDFVVVGEAGTAAEARARILPAEPDIAVFDARLPDGSGIDVCREVRSAEPRIRALILTSFDDEDALASAILAGADGYVLKEIHNNGLLAALREIAAGRSLLSPREVEWVRQRWSEQQQPDPLSTLSGQERRVLELVAAGYTNRQIAERLVLSEKTVKNYVTSILSKLGMQRRTQAAVYLTQHNLSGG